jgi:hypothetical protein
LLPEAKPPVAALSSAKVNVCTLGLDATAGGTDWSVDGSYCC